MIDGLICLKCAAIYKDQSLIDITREPGWFSSLICKSCSSCTRHELAHDKH